MIIYYLGCHAQVIGHKEKSRKSRRIEGYCLKHKAEVKSHQD